MKRFFLLSISVLFSFAMWGQHTHNTCRDSVIVCAKEISDSLQISIMTDSPRVQMSFLMQGVIINIVDTTNSNILSFHLPCAKDVRDKIHHHPNEVKAMHKNDQIEIRPDLQPLISALNGLPAQIGNKDSIIDNCKHYIYLDKETGNTLFTLYIPIETISLDKDSLVLLIESYPQFTNGGEEYVGKRLSMENRMPPRGLGNTPDESNAEERKVEIRRTIIVQKGKN